MPVPVFDAAPLLQAGAVVKVVGTAPVFACCHSSAEPAASAGLPCHPYGPAMNAGTPAASGFSAVVVPAFPVEREQAYFCQPAAESAGGLPCCAVHSCIPVYAIRAAALAWDSVRRSTAAGKPAAERVLANYHAATCPIRFAAAPSHAPSVDPIEVEHVNASLESRLAADGNNEPEYAG